MLKIACFCLAIAAAPLWSQVAPSASGGASLGDSQMMVPPPVGGGSYPEGVGSESRSNYLAGGLVFTGAYVDNLMTGGGASPISDETYSFLPTIGIDRNTSRQSETLGYSSGFTFYQHTSQLNSVTQSASAGYQFRISPYTAVVLSDTFRQNNDLYNQSNPFAGGGVSATPGQPNGVLISPYQNQLGNSSSAGIHYQYGRNAMIGGSGSYSFQQFSEPPSVSGLNNEGTAGASGFFSRRLGRSQYFGAMYQFSKFVTHPIDTYTLTNTGFGTYTFYFTRSISLSILGGAEHYNTWSATTPSQGAWTPAVQGSFGWQTLRTNVAATYSHTVSGAAGLIGTYHADIADLSGRFALSRSWNVGAAFNYSRFDNVNSSLAFANGTGGNGVLLGVYLDRRITERVHAQAGYGHFHQGYAGIPNASSNPDSNRANISIMYGFNHSLGR